MPDADEAAAASLTTTAQAAALRRVAHIVGAITARVPPLTSTSASHQRQRQHLALRACAAVSTSTAVVIGGVILDVQAAPAAGYTVHTGTSVPGTVRQTPGGVGRNIAEGLRRMSPAGVTPPLLISAVGDDLAGSALTTAWSDLGASLAGVRVCTGAATPVVAAVLDGGGEVAACVADTATAETGLDAAWVARFNNDIAAAAIVILDGNCTPDVLAAAAAAAAATRKPPPPSPPPPSPPHPRVWFEPVSVAKSTRAGAAGILPLLDFISPNAGELRAMANEARARRGERQVHAHDTHASSSSDSSFEFSSARDAVEAMHDDVAVMLREGVKHVVLTVGAMGVVLSSRGVHDTSSGLDDSGRGGDRGGGGVAAGGGGGSVSGGSTAPFAIVHRHFPALPARVSSLVGAGDSLVAGCSAALLAGLGVEASVAVGVAASRRAVETVANVPVGAPVAFEALRGDARDVLAGVQTIR
jgi:sugar/nucleoside kinase (ribokinase family)